MQMDNEKKRIIVLTDISTLDSKEGEPDDTQSLIRLLLYANEFNIEGLIASYTSHCCDSKPGYIEAIIKKYGEVYDNLVLHDISYPSKQELLDCVKKGNPKCGLSEVGDGRDTEGSEWIVSVLDKPDPRPVWILLWGAPTDLAQALWKITNTRSIEEMKKNINKLRIYSIGDQYDTTGQWIRENYKELFYITAYRVFRGMYKGGDQELVSTQWVHENICTGHGPLGEAYPNYDGGDLWEGVKGLKEGDSPAFLYLIPNGLGNCENPEWGSWGGRFERQGNHYFDTYDTWLEDTHEWLTVSRWRAAYQADFQARMDWCVKPKHEANHPPIPIVSGELSRKVLSGELVKLSASGSYDPDGDDLVFSWSFYREASSYKGKLEIMNAYNENASFIAPRVYYPSTIHIILTVTDKGIPALSKYKRIVIDIKP